MNSALLQAWSHVVGGRVPDDDLDLAACALLIAEIERPGLPAATYLAVLDRLAGASRAAARPGESLIDATLRHLFVEVGFRGNQDDYYDPKNSCLDEVLTRRLGIPITLSVVLLEVGWRLGLDLAGVGFPGRFLVRAREAGRERILDPFGGGATLDGPALEEHLARAIGLPARLAPEHVRTVGKREILARMLNNLGAIYRRAADAAKLETVVALQGAIGGAVRRSPN